MHLKSVLNSGFYNFNCRLTGNSQDSGYWILKLDSSIWILLCKTKCRGRCRNCYLVLTISQSDTYAPFMGILRSVKCGFNFSGEMFGGGGLNANKGCPFPLKSKIPRCRRILLIHFRSFLNSGFL